MFKCNVCCTTAKACKDTPIAHEKIISTAKAVGAYREIKKSKSRNSVQVKSPPWFDKECMEKRQQYCRVKNSLKRSGAKAMSYKKAKELKKFIKVKKKYYHNQLKNKIRTLRSSNSKDYWKLLNKFTESRISYNKICLQTFMEHFKKLNSVVEADDLSNDDLSGAAEKFPAQPNNELNYEFSDQELCVLIVKLKK